MASIARRSRSAPVGGGISAGSGNPRPLTTIRSRGTPAAATSSASSSETVTTAAAADGMPRASVASKARLRPTLRRRGRSMPSGSKTYGIRRARHHAAVPVVTGSRNPATWTMSGRRPRRRAGSVGVIPIQRYRSGVAR